MFQGGDSRHARFFLDKSKYDEVQNDLFLLSKTWTRQNATIVFQDSGVHFLKKKRAQVQVVANHESGEYVRRI